MKRVKAIFDVEVDYFLSDDKSTRYRIRYALKKKRYYLGIFPNMGGRGLPKSQNFCKFTKYFFVCQIHSEVLKHVLQRGVISDQFYHLKFIQFGVIVFHSGNSPSRRGVPYSQKLMSK